MISRRDMFRFWFPLLLGLMGVARIFGTPRLAAIRGVDLVRLIGIGMCFGVALTTLFTLLARSRDSNV